jgi:hypothetical protein
MSHDIDAPEYNDTPHQDDDMAEFWSEYGMPAPALLRLTYKNSSGQVTERLFETRLFTGPSSTFSVLGHCYARNAERTLRIDRIIHCIDERTGEAVADVYEHLFDLYRKTPDYSLDNVLDNHRDTLRALAYVLEAGGRWHSHGAAVIGIASRKLAGDDRITDAMLASHLDIVSGDSLQSYRMVIGRLSKALPAEAQAAMLWLATKVANLDGNISSDEQSALDYMTKRFANP